MFRIEIGPSLQQMLDQGMRFVLCQHANPSDIGVKAIGKGEVDDAELAAKRNSGLGPPIGQYTQAAASPSSQHEGKRVVSEATDKTRCLIRHFIQGSQVLIVQIIIWDAPETVTLTCELSFFSIQRANF